MASNASSIVLYPAPPPTFNTLDPAQRTRLIRSARKLGAVLGTTPFLLESHGALIPVDLLPASATRTTFRSHSHTRSMPVPVSPIDPSKKKRHGSVFDLPFGPVDGSPRSSTSSSRPSSPESLPVSTPRTSIESLPMPSSFSKGRRSGDAPRPLILRLNAVPLSPSDPRAQPYPITPTTASVRTPDTPTTPTVHERSETRRRKMAKVQRTLGEQVPPELVFHHASPPSLGLHAGHLVPPSPTVTAATTTACGTPAPAGTPNARTFPAPPIPPSPSRFMFARPRPRTPSKAKQHRRRSTSLNAVAGGPVTRLLIPPPVYASGVRAPKSERWVGAWNRQDIGQVQRELRAMKRR